MKKITLFALCMFVLGSGSAMAGSWSPRVGINEGNAYFNAIVLFNISGQSVFGVPALPVGDDFHYPGHDGSWHVTNPGAATGNSVTSLDFIVNLAETGLTPFQFYAGVYENGNLVNYVEFAYAPTSNPVANPEWTETLVTNPPPLKSVPEPSLVLLLGIGLGAVGLMMWRRGD